MMCVFVLFFDDVNNLYDIQDWFEHLLDTPGWILKETNMTQTAIGRFTPGCGVLWELQMQQGQRSGIAPR